MANRNKPLSAQALLTQQAVAVLGQHRDWRRWPPARQIDYLFSVTGTEDFYDRVGADSAIAQLYVYCVAGGPAAGHPSMRDFLLALAQRRNALLTRPELAPLLAQVGAHYRYRLRDLTNWTPQRKNVYAQLESLVRHLFDQYGDVPDWVINAWTATRVNNLGFNLPLLTINLGRGHSLRSFVGRRLPLSKRLEHEMRQAPAACTLAEAYRYAQLAARGALAWFGPVLESRLGRHDPGTDDEFWLKVVDFFQATPMVDPRQFGPVCDWIYQKRHVGIGNEPPQPGFSLKGRSMPSLLAHTEAWHRHLARLPAARPGDAAWTGLPIPDFVGGERGEVRITQLTTAAALEAEGREMQHCVGSYAHSCRKGRCAIFALRINDKPAITLEVDKHRFIVQARGRFNRFMDDDERHWVVRWLGEARLAMGKYI